MKEKRIVVTGIGPVSSIGIGKDNFWDGIVNERVSVQTEETFIGDELWERFHLHKINDFDISKYGIDKNKLEDIKNWKEGEEIKDLSYLIAAIKLALDDSGLDYMDEDNGIGLVLAHENIGLTPLLHKISSQSYEMLIDKKRNDLTKRKYFEQFYYTFLKSTFDLQSFVNLFHVAKVFNIHDYSLFINNACASGLYTFETASQIIKTGQAKAIVVASSDVPDIYKYIWFRDLGIYSEEGIIKPFCKDSTGMVFGDAGIGIVLEDLDNAVKRNATIYAEYLGGGFDLEGWKVTLPQIGNDSYQKAIFKALEKSDSTTEEIDLVCAHGVGSSVIDAYEARAITDVFGQLPQKPYVTAYKPYVGHGLGCSALLETAILLLSLKNELLLPVLNCANSESRLDMPMVKEKLDVEFNRVMKICCAFAGFNAAAVFNKIK